MKTNDQPTNMVARKEPARNSFKVTRPEPNPNDAEQLSQEVQEEEAELAAVLDGLNARQEQLKAKRQQALEAIQKEKTEKRAALIEDAADWREIARTSADPERAKEFFRKAKDAEAEATRLGVELNLNEPASAVSPIGKPKTELSTNRAIALIIVLFGAFVAATCYFGIPLTTDPMNAIGQSIVKNAPIRALLSFTLTFLTFLVATFFIRVAFPQFYKLWNNSIESERTLDSLIRESPSWAVLLSLLGLFYLFMELFARFYQSMYA